MAGRIEAKHLDADFGPKQGNSSHFRAGFQNRGATLADAISQVGQGIPLQKRVLKQ
jgi:hypothetical protein